MQNNSHGSLQDQTLRTTRLRDIDNITVQDSTLEESGYGSLLNSTRDTTAFNEHPFSSTPLPTVSRLILLSSAGYSHTPSRAASTPLTITRFEEDLITSLYNHAPLLVHKILNYLEPKELHNLALAKWKWRTYLKQHGHSWLRLKAYRDEVTARKENISGTAVEVTSMTQLESARSLLSNRAILGDLSNYQVQSQRATVPIVPFRHQSSPPRAAVSLQLPTQPAIRRPWGTSAQEKREKVQKLKRLLMK